MKNLYSLLLVSLITIAGWAQTKTIYDANAEKRPATGFHAVSVSHGIELLLTQGTEEGVAISSATKEERDAIRTEVVNGELRIYISQDMEKWWQQLRRKGVRVKAYVSFINLDKIKGSSGSRTTIDAMVSQASVSIHLSAGATLKGDISANRLDIDQSSGAQSDIQGKVKEIEVVTSSGAQFNGYKLVAESATAKANSGGSIEMSITKALVASASSGGSINYKGEASVSSVSTNSGGRVRKAS